MAVRQLIVTAALAAGVAGLLPAAAGADTFTVNRQGDPAPGDCTPGHCTLREAAIAATELDGNDTIELPGKQPYLLKRSSSLAIPEEEKGDLDLGDVFALGNDFKIVHPGSGRATIDASAADDRAIEVIGYLKLVKVKVTGGQSIGGAPGGGISVLQGALMVRKSRIVDNSAANLGGGIYGDDANVIVKKSLIARNDAVAHGGGIYADPDGRFELDRSTVANNEAITGDGGGVWAGTGQFNGSSLALSSTIANNEAGGDGGGAYVEAYTFGVTNSTITKNSAALRGGGLYGAPDSGTNLRSVTIARNRADSDDTGSPDSGGGIFADGGSDVVEIRNSLVVYNRRTGGGVNECDVPAPVGIDSLGGNLIRSEAAGCNQFDDPQDIIDADVRLGQLTAAGGPTETIPLKAGSPAINEADGPGAELVDQRGVERDDPDIGAYER